MGKEYGLLKYHFAKDEKPVLMMSLAIGGKNSIGSILCAEIKARHLWGITAGDVLPPMTELCIVDKSDNILFSSLPAGASFPKNIMEGITRSHAGEYELNYRSETYLVSYWNIFLEGRFSAPEWVVLLLESKKNVVRPLAQFRKIFTAVIVITFGIVLLLSIRQIRRSTVPIQILQEGTQKVSEGDLGHQVEIKSGDEFENLGRSFNKMSRKLKEDQALLIQTAKMSAMGQMAAGIVHEINQPLSAMFGLIQLTLMEEPEGQRKERLQQVEKSIERLGEIVRKFKSFSRSSEERMQPVNVNDPLIQVVDLLKHQLAMKGVACEQNLADDPPMISGDANGLQQVFMNIIVNAIDAFENEQVIKKIVKIETGAVEDKVYVIIEDNGCGIPNDLKTRIFDPFFTTKNADKGAGLGLAIIESILHKHGATIKLDSEVGTGARFSIYFPELEIT